MGKILYPALKTCKHCDKPAKRFITPNGRNKGWYRTCGGLDCLNHRYLDQGINAKKAYSARKIEIHCAHCDNTFIKTTYKHKWCSTCVPDKEAYGIMHRYNMSKVEHTLFLLKNNGICPICMERKASVVDHDHKTGRIREAICNHCNMALNLIEKEAALQRAIKYVEKYNSL